MGENKNLDLNIYDILVRIIDRITEPCVERVNCLEIYYTHNYGDICWETFDMKFEWNNKGRVSKN